MTDRRVGYVPGVFDMFHVGHLNILRNSLLVCDYLIAGVVSDERATCVKGNPPVVPEAERLEVVRAIRYVDEAVIEDVPEKLDWRGTAKGDKLERDFAAVGVEVVYLPYTVHTSSSMLRQVLHQRIAASS
jgi:glycerol-3-phosphate cytidylyltransferase